MDIVKLEEKLRPWSNRLLAEHWGSTRLVSRGRLYDGSALDGFVAIDEGAPVGLATYRIEGDECELTTLNSEAEGRGVGSALIDSVKKRAAEAGCRRLWLITTNDNVKAVGFYQKRGFSLVALHREAIECSRKLKPEIPEIGLEGIPIRDELELEVLL
jgi:ribosomal protein S18 acetylase RimI-like enzyme